MAAEIELKAHIEDPEKMRLLLSQKAEFLYAFEKADHYWVPSLKEARAPEEREALFETPPLLSEGLRIRRERRVFPDGKTETLCLATHKTKRVKDGVEINDEREFRVEPVTVFEEFLALSGLKPKASKKKRGWAFSYAGITAELLEVPGLGWFLELEIVSGGAAAGSRDGASSGSDGAAPLGRSEIFREGKKRLLDFLSGLGMAEDKLESRFYSEMLKEAREAPR